MLGRAIDNPFIFMNVYGGILINFYQYIDGILQYAVGIVKRIRFIIVTIRFENNYSKAHILINGERLRELRTSHGYSREKFAELIGIGTTQVYNYENNKSDSTGVVIKRIAQFFDVTSDYLLGLSDSPEGHQREFTEDEIAIINRILNGKLKDVAQAILGTEAGTS